MTRSALHSETTISMISPDALLNDPFGSLTQRECVSSRQLAVQERWEHKINSGACYMSGKEVRMFRRDTGVGIASPQLMPFTDSHVDEESAVPLSNREARIRPSRSSSTTSRFVDRLGTGVCSLSSLRTIPSWRNTFPRAHKTYARIERGHDVGGGFRSDSPSLPHLRGGTSPSQHSSSGNLQNNSLRHRRRHAAKRTKSQNNVFHTPLSDLLTRFSHAMTISSSGYRDSGTGSSFGSNSLATQHSSSFDSSYIPFPSMSDDSSRTFPSPYSPDAAAVFQAPPNKSDAPHFFDGHVKFRGIFEDHMQVVFEEATDRTSSSASTNTCVSSSRTASKPPGLLVRSRRRVSALARAVTPARCKFLSVFDKKRSRPRPADDNDPVEYDIPCLAYVTCLW
jgi:hypothetical protein